MDFIVEAYTSGNVAMPVESSEVATEATANSSKPIDPIEKEVQNVLDVLPHLESDLVRKLLTRYENTELAIAAVLEGNLPPDLQTSIEPEANPSAEDDLTKLVDQVTLEDSTRVIIKGSKTQKIRPRAEKRILDDKRHVRELQTRYTEYGYVTDDDYNDEYDDSYDALTESETKSVHKNLRNTGALNIVMDDVDDSDDDEEEEDNTQQFGASGGDSRTASKDFCENPELIRERWARNRQAKYGGGTSTASNA